MTLVTTVLPIALLSGIGIKMTKDSLRGEIETNIENMAVEKARAIETTLFSKIDETVILATHPLIVTAVRASNAQRYRGGDDSEVLDEILALDREWIEQAAGSPVSLSIASIHAPIFSRILPEGSERGFKGEEWHSALWVVLMDIDQDTAYAPIGQMIRAYTTAGILVAIVIFIVASMLSTHITWPLKSLDDGLQVLSKGDLTFRFALSRSDEFGEFADAFNNMTENLQAITSSQRILARALEQSTNMVVITDTNGQIEYANPRFLKFMGYELAEVIGQNPRIFQSGETAIEVYEDLWRTILSGNDWVNEIRNKRRIAAISSSGRSSAL